MYIKTACYCYGIIQHQTPKHPQFEELEPKCKEGAEPNEPKADNIEVIANTPTSRPAKTFPARPSSEQQDMVRVENIGYHAFNSGNLELAERAYLNLISRDKNHEEAYFQLSQIYLSKIDNRKSEFSKACDILIKGIQNNPEGTQLGNELYFIFNSPDL